MNLNSGLAKGAVTNGLDTVRTDELAARTGQLHYPVMQLEAEVAFELLQPGRPYDEVSDCLHK
jgi:hypothetical protein